MPGDSVPKAAAGNAKSGAQVSERDAAPDTGSSEAKLKQIIAKIKQDSQR